MPRGTAATRRRLPRAGSTDSLEADGEEKVVAAGATFNLAVPSLACRNGDASPIPGVSWPPASRVQFTPSSRVM